MFDIWMGDMEITTVVLILSIAVLLPGQLLLCFKVKRRAIRLLPVILLAIPTSLCVVMAIVTSGWGSIGYLLLAILAGFMLLVCGLAWAIWAAAKLVRKKRENNKPTE